MSLRPFHEVFDVSHFQKHQNNPTPSNYWLPSVKHGGLGRISPLSFSLMLALGSAWIEPSQAANIQADSSAPKTQQATILQTSNGLPQVNIQTPTAAGVSINQYRQFDVDSHGAILNNSRRIVQTQQGAWIQANPWLATGEAKIIVNQINSQNPSLLNGYVEIAGQKAEVILANPAGIQVNGGGFINANGATLTTGTPFIRSGHLDGYAVQNGSIRIHGKGLNSKETDFTRLLSRYMEVDAPIWANDLQIVSGSNDFSATGQITQKHAANSQRAVAIDSSELGGMYANKISLITSNANERINNKGQIFAYAGGVSINANGELNNTGTVASQGTTQIQATALHNQGTLSSKEQFELQVQQLNNSGTVLATGEWNARVSGSLKQTQSGNIEAARLDVETAKLDNSGTISQTGLQGLAIESTGALTNSGKIGYPEADNTAPTTANGGTTGTTVPTQNTPSSATGSGNATAVSSPSSIQNFATGSLKTHETLNNSGTINANGGVDLTAKNGLNNTAELQLNKLAVSGNVLDNSQAKISAQSTEIQTQSVNNAQGELLASKTLNISTGQLDNRAGKLQSVDNANLTVSGSLNNQKGEIAANNALNIQDKQAQNLHIDNTDGTIVANHVSLQSKSLNNQGKLAAGNHLSIDLKDDFTVERNLEAGNKLNIKTAGSLNNSQTIQAESEVNIQAKQNINNRGTMNSNGLTRVEAGQELLNIGTGKIYGNHVALAADSLVNRDENGKAAVVTARERLDIGARKIENQEAALLSSEGDLGIGGSLNAEHKVTGLADSLINGSARIEAQGNGNIAVKELRNLNNHFKKEEYLESSNRVTAFTFDPDPTHYIVDKDGTEHTDEDDFYFTFTDRSKGVQHYFKGDVSAATKFKYTEHKYRERITNSVPSEIMIGKNLTISGTDWQNKDSKILVSKNIIPTSDGSGLSIQNLETLENQRTEKVDAEKTVGRYGHRRRTSIHKRILFDQWESNITIPSIQTHTPFENGISIVETNSQHTGHNQQTATDINLNTNNIGTIKSLNQKSTLLPTNSIYTINPKHSGWLVETDPAFVNYKQWLGSDYMLNALKTDPNHIHKRLGDGYYEQKLVNEQINRLTGYRRLDGYSNDEEQFKALMNSGITAAHSFGLSVGVALSAEQVARLTSDIVWLETQTVTLPDGSTQTVLVPKVYVVARKGDLNTSGSLLSADKINLNIANGTLKNGGTIGARQVVAINAKDIENGGHLQADKIALQANNAILFNGGTAQADSLFSANAKDINISSTTSTSGNKRNGTTVLDRVAAIYVGGNDNQQGNLVLNAENQLNLTAAQLHNLAGNGNTILQGQTVNLNTVRTENHETYGELSDKKHRHVHQTAEIGSQIQTQGNIAIVGDDVAIRQGNINSQNGHVAIAAKDQLNVEEGRQTLDMDVSTYSKSRGILSSTKSLNQFQHSHDTASGSSITGQSIALSAKDISIRGSDVVATDDVLIQATENVSITAAQNQQQDAAYSETKKSGLMGTGGLGIFIGSKKTTDDQDNTSLTHTASTVGSLKGNTTIEAGKNYEQTGSIVRSVEGDTLIAAQKIDVKAAENRYTNDHIHTQKQSGVTVAVNAPVVQLAQSAMAIADNAKQVGQSKNDRVNAMAAANTAWQAYETHKSAKQALSDPKAALTDVSATITYGKQKNRHESHSTATEAQPSQIISGGTSTLIATGAGKESDINITGSDVLGGKGTYLFADDAINLTSAQQHSTENSNNKSSGWNVGGNIGLQNWGVTAGGNKGKGHGNGESLTHRHTQVGDSNSVTVLQSGGQTTIKGTQVHGKGIDLSAQDLLIESVQDTAKFNSKQENISGQVTIGGGASVSGSYNKSKVNADHASVNQQSGIYAGDDGYRAHVTKHTDLKGGLITSTAKAEADGKNQFSTNSLSHSDIENHSHYDAKGMGVSGGFGFNGDFGLGDKAAPQSSMKATDQEGNVITDANGNAQLATGKASVQSKGKSIGYGSDGESERSVTQSGINTKNIQIQQDPTGELAKSVYTDITTETAAQHSGSLKNSFDKDKVQQEIDLQVKVSQDFNRNVQAANGEINKQIDKLKQQLDKGQISQSEYDRKVSNWQQGSVLLNSIAAGLGAPTDSVAGIATATLAPAVSYRIGQAFKKSNEEGSLKHILAHAIVGAVVAQSGGNNALAGALSAGGAEAIAPRVAEYLYGKKGSELNAEQKETVSSIMSLAGAATGAIIGNSATNAVQGSLNAENAVENNYLTKKDIIDYKKEIKQKCGKQDKECMHDLIAKLKQTNEENRKKLESACASNKNSSECLTHKELAREGLMEANKVLFTQDDIVAQTSNTDDNIATQSLSKVYVKDKGTVTQLTGFSVNEYATSENLKDIADAETNRGNAQAIQAALNNHTVNDGLIYKVATNTLNEHNPSIWHDSNLAIDTTINTGKSTVTKTIDKIETGINDTIDDIKKSYDDLTERPKETISQWWEDKKETGKNVKDFVVDMATNPTVREEASDSVFENIDKNIQKGKHNLDLLKMGNPNEVEDIVSDTTSNGIIELGQAAAGGVVTKAGGVAIGGITKDKDTPKKVNNDKKAQVDTDYIKSNIEKNKIARESFNFDFDRQKRIEHNAKLTTTVDGNLSVTHGLGYDAKKELDGIRVALIKDQEDVKAFNKTTKRGERKQESLVKAGFDINKDISVATATVTTKDGKTINYLAVSGQSWNPNAPDKITINGKEYQVLRDEAYIIRADDKKEKVLEDKDNLFARGKPQKNGNHAEKKIMSHITQQNQNGANIDSIQLNIQNTSDEFKGACYGCGGKDGTGGTIQDFKNLNKDLKIHIEHGSTGTTP